MVPRLCRGAVSSTDDSAGDLELRRAGGGDVTARIGVDRRLVVRIVADAFDNVDLAAGGPVWSYNVKLVSAVHH